MVTNQNDTFAAGDPRVLVIPVIDSNGQPVPLNGGAASEVKWVLGRDPKAAPLIIKTLTPPPLPGHGGITVNSNQASIALAESDTINLATSRYGNVYFHELTVTLLGGSPVSVCQGSITIMPSPAKP